MASGAHVLLSTSAAGVRTLVLNTPRTLNSMTPDVGGAFKAAVVAANRDMSVRALVVTGAGPAFSSGGNLGFLKQRIDGDPRESAAQLVEFYSRFLVVRKSRVPVVAAINGTAFGAGICLALACDYRICESSAKLSFNFARLGIHSGMAGSYYLPKLVRPDIATRLLLTGEVLTGRQAYDLGIVSEVADGVDSVKERAGQLAAQIASNPPEIVQAMLRTLRRQQDVGLNEALYHEGDCQAKHFRLPYIAKNIDDFERRPRKVE